MSPVEAHEWRGWVPVELIWFQRRPVVKLLQLSPAAGEEPFWEQALQRCTGRPRLLPLDDLPEPPGGPAGFVFHMTRCGSTLVSRMLGALPGRHVLSEPLIFEALLAAENGSVEERGRWLRQLFGLHTRALCAEGEPLFIKWSSGACRHVYELESAWPDVPKLFIHRDPVEVLVSRLERPPPVASRSDPDLFAPHLRPADPAAAGALPDGELIARYVGSCCHWMTGARTLRLLAYDRLPDAVWTAVAGYFGLELDDEDRSTLRSQAGFYSKDRVPRPLFLPDSLAKQVSADAGVREWAARFVAPELERLRARHPSL
jgi:hypothetical protein